MATTYTSTISLAKMATSDPFDVTLLNGNADTTDAAIKKAYQGKAARNWLDNSDFTNAVNQRGFSSTSNNAVYCIDRWKTEAGGTSVTVSATSAGITLTPSSPTFCGVEQFFEQYAEMSGKTYTLALCCDGEWDCVTLTIGQTGGGKSFKNGLIVYSISQTSHPLLIRNPPGGSEITIQRAALYEGSYTTDTLPAYVPKGYAAELAECQRYFYAVKGSKPIVIAGLFDNAGCLDVCWPLPVKMRVTPTITCYRYSSGTWTSNSANVAVNGTVSAVTPGGAYYCDTGFASLRYINNSYPNKSCYVMFGFTASADL